MNLPPRSPQDAESQTVPPDGRPMAEQPEWRKDFPIDWGQDDYVARRDLIKFIVLTSGALAVGQLWLGWKRFFRRSDPLPAGLAIATVDELPIGGAKTFWYPAGSTPRLLVRTGPSGFVAYDQQCTHLLCPIVPAVAEGRLHCPCHNGWFDLHTGRALEGPPRRPLPRVLLEVRGDTVYATGIEQPTA